jgi:hypothetical protein
MRKEFVMRGKTAKGETEVLNFGSMTKENQGMAYRLVEFILYPSLNLGNADAEMTGIISAGKTPLDPDNPDFNDEACIGTTLFVDDAADHYPASSHTVINDTFMITQNLLLTVKNTEASDINWQCRFEAVKMTGPETAVTNYKQFAISDGS